MNKVKLLKGIDTFKDEEKIFTPKHRLEQLLINKALMIDQLMYLKGENLARCKWTIDNYNQQIKKLKGEINKCTQS